MATPPILGKYTIRRELAQGSMGIVYEGFDPMIGRRVAIKTLRREQLERSEVDEVMERFRREAQSAGRLAHPNICQVYEYGEDGPTAFIAMEFLEGENLRDYFARNKLVPLPEVFRIMSQLLDVLDYSHKNGVVHRDIKPANIVMLTDGLVKVTDFGIARTAQSNLTQVGSVLGTPSYMSPEQFMGQKVDGRADLFSAGILLYRFLTGEKPFDGNSLSAMMQQVLKENPPPPSSLNPRLPKVFDALIVKVLAKAPNDRYQTGKDFLDALRIAMKPGAQPEDLARLSGDAPATAAAGATAAKAAPTQPMPAPAPSPAGGGKSGMIGIVIVVVIALAVAAWFMLRK